MRGGARPACVASSHSARIAGGVDSKLRTVLVWVVLLCAALLALGAAANPGSISGALAVALVLFFVIVAFVLWLRQRGAQSQLGQVNAFRQSRARMITPGTEKTRFADVGGLEAAKTTLGDVVDWLRAPERWAQANVRPPRGVLLEGPPGSGKTLLARAVAGEAGVKFFVANATEFVELYVGVGPARVRDLFEAAAKEGPCVIFIDEIDAIGRRRGSGVGITHEEREQALNELLVQMDGFERRGRVVVIGASNRADVLDSALLRPGRFDLRVRVGDLSAEEREAVLRVHARGRQLAEDVDLSALAQSLAGASGALLELVMNRAAFASMRRMRPAAGGASTPGTPGSVGGAAGAASPGAAPGTGATAAPGWGRSAGRAAATAATTAPIPPSPITGADLLAAVAEVRGEAKVFSALDQLLVESASQLSEPMTTTWAEIEVSSGARVVGRLVWATPEFLKIEPADGGPPRLLARRELRELRPASAPGAAS